MNIFVFVLYVGLFIASGVEESLSARIIATGVPGGHSHDFVFERIGRALVSRGHEFVQIVAKDEMPLFSKRLRPESGGVVYYDCPASIHELETLMHDTANQSPLEASKNYANMIYRVCDKYLSDPTILRLFEEKPIDILLFDTAFMCPVMLAERYNITKKVAVSNVGFLDPLISHTFGYSVPLAWVPLMRLPYYDHMGFKQRLLNTGLYVASTLIYDNVQKNIALPFYHSHGGKGASIVEIARDSLLLVQGTWGLDFVRDLPPNIKFVGAILNEDPKQLPESYKTWMDSATEGVVIVSFGSVVNPTAAENVELLTAFSMLPYKVVWKLRKDHRDGLPEQLPSNIRVEEWLPLNDLFYHPNTKLFLTHCGMNSMLESINAGIPMIGFPKFADQFDNCKHLASANVGKCLLQQKYTSNELSNMMIEVASTPSYKESVLRLRGILKDAGGVDEVVKWIEYVLQHGYQHLIPWYQFELNWMERHLLDIVAVIVLIFTSPYWLYKLFKYSRRVIKYCTNLWNSPPYRIIYQKNGKLIPPKFVKMPQFTPRKQKLINKKLVKFAVETKQHYNTL